MSGETVGGCDGHRGEMPGVRSYGDHCRHGKRACVKGSLELGVVNGVTYLLQDCIRRGICEVNVDEWDDGIIVQVIVYDDVVEQKMYRTVRDMFPDTALKATRDNKTWEKLSKPISVLVELGSKDSVEYRNSEEYKKEHANKTEKQQMDTEKQWIVSQVRLVYDYAIEQLEKASENKVPVGRHVLDQIVAGLWLVVKGTLGDGFSMDAKIRARDEDPRDDAPVAEETDTGAREEVPNGDDHRKNADPDAPVPVECERKRYAGDAMIMDDISRHSRYDLKGVDFRIPLVEWVDNVDGHDVWRAFVNFLIDGKLTESSFKFSEAGSAIANSAMAFDYMVSCLPNLGLRLKEEK